MQAETTVRRFVIGLEPAQHVDLFVDLALAQELLHRFDDAGLDVREAVQLECRTQ